MRSLARLLGIPRAHAVGLLEALWHWCARFCPQGDIGKWDDAAIADGAMWEANAGEFVAALVEAKWLDTSQTHRLTIHDWQDHADDYVRKYLKRHGLFFVQTTAEIVQTTAENGGICPPRARALPVPVPVPKPVPIAAIRHDEEFVRAWDRWPAKGRMRRPLCEQNWCEIFGTLDQADCAKLIGEIHEGIDRWLASGHFAKGMVHGFADFLAQRRWAEEPEPAEPEENPNVKRMMM